MIYIMRWYIIILTMQKDSEFQEIVSEDDVDFEMSAAKLMRNQKYLNL